MLFKFKTVAKVVTTASAGLTVLMLLFNPAVSDEALSASPPSVLAVDDADVEVGQVVGTGAMEGDA